MRSVGAEAGASGCSDQKENPNVTSKTADLQEGADEAREVLASTHRATGEGRPIPKAAAAGPEPGGVDVSVFTVFETGMRFA